MHSDITSHAVVKLHFKGWFWSFDVVLYEVLISVLPAVDDHQLSPCVEKQRQEADHCIAVNGTKSKMYFSHRKEGPPKEFKLI